MLWCRMEYFVQVYNCCLEGTIIKAIIESIFGIQTDLFTISVELCTCPCTVSFSRYLWRCDEQRVLLKVFRLRRRDAWQFSSFSTSREYVDRKDFRTCRFELFAVVVAKQSSVLAKKTRSREIQWSSGKKINVCRWPLSLRCYSFSCLAPVVTFLLVQ